MFRLTSAVAQNASGLGLSAPGDPPECAKRERIIVPLTAEELQRLFAELGPRERTLVLRDVPTGMRKGEVLPTQWYDIDFGKRTLNVRKSIWQQLLGPVKTEESQKIMPLDEEMITDIARRVFSCLLRRFSKSDLTL